VIGRARPVHPRSHSPAHAAAAPQRSDLTFSAPTSRFRARFLVVGAVGALAIFVGFGLPLLHITSVSGTDAVKADPPPQLFNASEIDGISGPVADQAETAHAAMAKWWATHGTNSEDTAFLAWVEGQVPAPPSKSARAAELRDVQSLKTKRTKTGVAAATWLEVHGKKDIWKLYLHDQRELESPAIGAADKASLKLILQMAKTASDQLAAKDKQSAPYVLDPSLRTDKTVKKGAVCPCSYPSRHAARAAGSREFLGYVAPRRLADYEWMEDEVAYSRLYMAGHVESDITAGSELGDMIGEYVLVTRGRMPLPSH
jgi:hypothetical protein